jgi:DNA-binding Lrp family transcriptional regulator
MLNDLERKILAAIQHGMPNTLTPYEDMAASIGISVEQLLDTLKTWKTQGKIRRVGAIVNHFQLGYGVGAMVAWDIPKDKIDDTGQLFASFAEVSHAYQRPSAPGWPYTLYTMVHAATAAELDSTIRAMSQASGIEKFQALKTIRELKKVPPTYIVNPKC